jgi:hypothetical protein
MASVWIVRFETREDGRNRGRPRYRVRFRAGGRESAIGYAGAFGTLAAARARRDWVARELGEGRMPDFRALVREPERAPTVSEAAKRWQASRLDVTAGTRASPRSPPPTSATSSPRCTSRARRARRSGSTGTRSPASSTTPACSRTPPATRCT